MEWNKFLRVDSFSRFVQISIEDKSPLLPKFLKYAEKYFQNRYHLSSSILILDDGERFKKDYLINWAYYSAMQEIKTKDINNQEIDFQEINNLDNFKNPILKNNLNLELHSILKNSYLPIRIKITSSNSLLERVRISFKLLGLNRAVLILDRPNHVAKRYVAATLSNIVITSDLSHIYLDSTKDNFWYCIMSIIGNKIIHNVRLEFDYDSFKMHKFSRGFKSSYLTKNEKKLYNAYFVLGCDQNDNFFDIKAKYLELIKKYHPDKVFGKDELIIKSYNLKFIELKEAFDIIKTNFENN